VAGGTSPQIHLLLPQIQKLADRSDAISEVPKCSKIQIFQGLGERCKILQLMGRGLTAPIQEPPPPLSALRPRFYGSQDLTHYRVGNPINNRFQMLAYMKFVFFRFRGTETMDSMMKGLNRPCLRVAYHHTQTYRRCYFQIEICSNLPSTSYQNKTFHVFRSVYTVC